MTVRLDPHSAVGAKSPRQQIAALPFRRAGGGEVMLVSSRETRRWVLPKGWPMKGLKPHAAAAREALEEAGLEGRIGKDEIGSYNYDKRLGNGLSIPCKVTVYPLEVSRQKAKWPEKDERQTRWFSFKEAAAAVDETDLGDLIRAFGEALGAKGTSGPDL